MGATGFLLPDLDDEEARPFWEGTALGELRVQSCAACGAWRMPPRPMCPVCRSLDAKWVVTNGRGTIYSFIVAHPPLLPAYAELAPYNAIIVALEENPTIRFVGNLLERPDGPINEVDTASIAIDQPVQVVFQQIEDVALPRWVRT
ncbi:MAG TPA: OB-fold domain-containing protein [Acidimicrobiia bacterium]|jgi:hypothetical protein